MNTIPPDPTAHHVGRLMHDLTVVNTQLARYVVHYLDVDAGRAAPMPTADERALADRVAAVAVVIKARANRRDSPTESR